MKVAVETEPLRTKKEWETHMAVYLLVLGATPRPSQVPFMFSFSSSFIHFYSFNYFTGVCT